ncbi:LON peptidase substrate-binding domain-containing protein [bacterium]|nr:LON peptidase substrate-binding domain-containing protein [bacterium]|tara:strand:- start:1060 stop:1704 length:645 start_codon:yes stop_codon:yes gene_type:complete
MNKINDLPDTLSVFPLSNFIFFPNTSAPLNVFEPRYIQMIDESVKSNRMIGMIQPKGKSNLQKPELFKVGCLGKISSFNETEDGRYVIVLKGITRFNTLEEINNGKLFREFKINYKGFENDITNEEQNINFSDLNLIFNNLKSIFEKQGYIINWNELEKQSLDQTINTLSMASPFSKEEKQMLLEAKDLEFRKKKLEQIIKLYNSDIFSNKTLQ